MAIKNSAFEEIPTHVKDQGLVERRRTQIADAAVEMFLERGFHKTTTRQIARAAGISNGLLYEYVSSKEDILYLVCTLIHTEMQNAVSDALTRADAGIHPLAAAIRDYLRVCHRMGDHILLIYQETQSLPAKWRKVVLENEIRITELFADVLRQLVKTGELSAMDRDTLDLIAHNISVLGHMWAFRRWFLAGRYTIDDYIRMQTEFILARCREAGSEQPTGLPGKTPDEIPN
ncbi:TetR/AcrR family transcriptional regulator [Desulfatitalea tepidiphila]|uniref:TetR/AcrR family transcriptional regulator n=1 Tax=Desulfatitalea tepidiphila TaxID=1185843 RepID=UPI0009777BB1|nr:TetR/AcrR family transcriptional regulator [Desulfatitalea tepidiphila]